ncbi:hypothetical protein VPG91_06795 [Nitrospirillum amazonense]|uniref:hypothetical protein n=1 Tax=Nitrospirillum amazonense TaxID=28077 RepID=UPI002DD434A5|nr:hypothetical protein [Nitrospirillum amazonense]MEC4590688.1 hypothetical protein [Nitrospirillum amazonense]
MNQNTIQNLVDKLMQETAGSLNNSLKYYWPSKTNKNTGNALHEGNILMHLGRACLNNEWVVYQQAARHSEADQQPPQHGASGWLDMLAYNPQNRIQLRVEAKRFIKSDSFSKISDDIQKINNFRLNRVDNAESEILNPKFTVGLIAVVTHDQRKKDWWDQQHANSEEDAINTLLSRHLRNTAPAEKDSTRSLSLINSYSNGWLLYAWHFVP